MSGLSGKGLKVSDFYAFCHLDWTINLVKIWLFLESRDCPLKIMDIKNTKFELQFSHFSIQIRILGHF
jgi:hypothetical protein